MATLVSHDNTSPPGDRTIIQGVAWRAQTFTPTMAAVHRGVRIRAGRIGSPGTVTVSIRATNAQGSPTGADLASGTTDGNTLPVIPPLTNSELREVAFTTPVTLDASTQYAIVVSAAGGDANNRVDWQIELVGTYTGGAARNSADSGATWTSDSWDAYFEVVGTVLGDTLLHRPIGGKSAAGVVAGRNA